MKSTGCLSFFITLLISAANPAFAQPQTNPDPAVIMMLIQKTEKANNAGNVEAWVSLFHDEAVYMAPGAPPVTTMEGLTEIAKSGFRHGASIEIEPVEIQICEDWAFAQTHVTGNVMLAGSGRCRVPPNTCIGRCGSSLEIRLSDGSLLGGLAG